MIKCSWEVSGAQSKASNLFLQSDQQQQNQPKGFTVK